MKNTIPLLKFDNISKSYGNQCILKHFSLEIEKGESLAIVGPSGSGKTTFLNIAGALDIPDTGNILFNNLDISRMTDNERSAFRNKNVGFVFQMHYLLPQCTVFENVLIPTLTYNNTSDKINAVNRAKVLLERLGMMEHRDKLPGQLSGGECQRTAFVRALINQPELILADEPTGSLDEESAAVLSSELINLNKELNTTLIVVTHSIKLAEQMNRVLYFKNHQLTAKP